MFACSKAGHTALTLHVIFVIHIKYKHKNQLNKLWNEVGMAVPKSTQTRIAGMVTYK